MKLNKLLIISTITIVAYLPCAPIFFKSEYGTQSHTSLPVAQSYSYLWIERNDSLLFLGLCGFWNYRMQERTHLMFRDKQGSLSQVVINDALFIVDGHLYQAADLKNKMVTMDNGLFNGYAGKGTSASLDFSLPVVPKKSVKVKMQGDAIDDHGRKRPFSIAVESDVISESSMFPLFKYFYEKLTET